MPPTTQCRCAATVAAVLARRDPLSLFLAGACVLSGVLFASAVCRGSTTQIAAHTPIRVRSSISGPDTRARARSATGPHAGVSLSPLALALPARCAASARQSQSRHCGSLKPGAPREVGPRSARTPGRGRAQPRDAPVRGPRANCGSVRSNARAGSIKPLASPLTLAAVCPNVCARSK